LKGRILQFFDRIFYSVEITATIIGMFIIPFLVFVGISRYFLKQATPYEEELTLLLHIWLVNLGFSLVLRYGDHAVVTIFYDKLVKRERFGKAYQSFIILINLAFIAIVMWYFYQTFPLLTRGVTEYMRWPFIWYYSALVVGFVFMAVRYLMKIIYSSGGVQR